MTTDNVEPRLFCFGLGYSATVLARALLVDGWAVAGTCREEERKAELDDAGMDVVLFDRGHPLDDPAKALAGVTHLLVSVPPDKDGDPVLDLHGEELAAVRGLRWAGYLSTTGVYGDTGGMAVDESAALNPTSERSRQRVAAEEGWRGLGLPLHVFRLSGIYGPGRSMLDKVRDGTARRIHRPGHLFSRIHVDDIAAVLRASMARPNPGAIYNVADDIAAAAADVTEFACRLLAVEPPAAIPFEAAARDMSPMALSFWQDNRRIDNSRMKSELGVSLAYPDYKAGLKAILAAEGK